MFALFFGKDDKYLEKIYRKTQWEKDTFLGCMISNISIIRLIITMGTLEDYINNTAQSFIFINYLLSPKRRTCIFF
jgi:hypothetical protein